MRLRRGAGCYSRSLFLTNRSAFESSTKIFSGTSNLPLAKSIAAYVGIEVSKSTVSAFPDGETFVKVEENVRGEDVFLLQSTSPPTNHNLMEMFILMDALRRASASRITAVLPFYGYARQDRKDQPRVPITAKLVANLFGWQQGQSHPDDGCMPNKSKAF